MPERFVIHDPSLLSPAVTWNTQGVNTCAATSPILRAVYGVKGLSSPVSKRRRGCCVFSQAYEGLRSHCAPNQQNWSSFDDRRLEKEIPWHNTRNNSLWSVLDDGFDIVLSNLLRRYEKRREGRAELLVAGATRTRHYYRLLDGVAQQGRDEEPAELSKMDCNGDCSFNWGD